MTPASQLFPPGAPGYKPTVRGQHYDLEAALEHMARAGYAYDPKTGKGGYPKTLTYTAYGFYEYSGQILAQQLAKIGVRIDLRVVSSPEFAESVIHGKSRISGSLGWVSDYPDPATYFDLFDSGQTKDGQSISGTFYKNAQYDDLLARARHELDPAKRTVLYDEANQIVCDDAPWAFTHFYHAYEVRQPYLRGYTTHPVWEQNVRFAWLDRGGATALAKAEPAPLGGVLASLFGALPRVRRSAP